MCLNVAEFSALRCLCCTHVHTLGQVSFEEALLSLLVVQVCCRHVTCTVGVDVLNFDGGD